MRQENLPRGIEVFEVGARRLYVKMSRNAFALFEDELTPEELVSIARDIESRQTTESIQTALPVAVG